MRKTVNFLLAAAVFAGACTSRTYVPQRDSSPASPQALDHVHRGNARPEASQKDKLLISLLPAAPDGEFILERNLTALTKHKDQVKSDGMLSDYSFKITGTPGDIDVVRIPNNSTPENCLKTIISALDDHIKKYGKLSVLEIVGHGRTNTMALGENSPTSPTIDNKQILKSILDYQTRTNFHAADTILLGGCGVMSQLSRQDARDYNEFAKNLHSKIIGSTITVSAEAYNDKGTAGLYAVFDGSKSVAVDTALSHVDYYIRDRKLMGNDSTDYESPTQIEENSRWMETFNRNSKNRRSVSPLLATLKI